ncbi:MAG TPA: hypothetical protein VI282_20160 [Verrucomicrobiae bacterium]|jgi:hypothetical protein
MSVRINKVQWLKTPISLEKVAQHLASGADFLLHPCRASELAVLELVTKPQGYLMIANREEETVFLTRRRPI